MIRCSACGHENPDTNRFCGNCAAPLVADARPPEVRKTVTVLFCDLVGSTAIGESLDPEKLRMVTRRYFDAMRAPIDRHGGTVEKFIGDAVMAVFGVPQVHEDDALRAVRAAADMRDVLRELNPELDRDHGVTLACRIGVNTGEVVTGSSDAVVVGDAVNVAARLEQAASPGEILLGEATHRLVREAVTAELVDALNLKGKADPVPAYRLIDVTPGAAGFSRHLDAPIVGRERELALLRTAFERTAGDRSCHLFTLLGVPGVGKSRLMAAFVDALGDDATILRGRCLPYGEGITFYPLAEALIEAADLREVDAPDAARAKLAALVGDDPQADRIAELVGQAIGISGSDAAPDELFWAVRVLLQHLAAARPLVFVVDDLQWAEPKLLELVEHVVDFAGEAPILLACMARPELVDDHPRWGGGKLNATSTLLEPLDPEACAKLVSNLLAVTVDESVRARIVEAAEGNPLYAEEVTGLLVDEGSLVLNEGRWTSAADLTEVPVPVTISALLAARLDKLPAAERRLLDMASVMGQVFYPAAVRSLADGAADVGPGLQSLVRHQFIRQARSDLPEAEALAFRHLLIRDAAYETIPKAGRAELHERFAGWLDDAGGTLGEQDEIVGYHLEQAYRFRTELGAETEREQGLAEAAGRRLAAAGERAFARRDVTASSNLLRRASGLLTKDDPLQLRVLPDLAASLADGGDLDAAHALAQDAIERARAAGDQAAEMHAVLQLYWTRAEMSSAEAERMAEEALAVFEAIDDERGLSSALMTLSEIRFGEGKMSDAVDLIERSLLHARAAGSPSEEASAYERLGTVFARGDIPIVSAIERCHEILAQTAGNRTIAATMFHPLGHMLARRGEFEEALGFAGRCRDIQRENGAMWSYWTYTEIVWDIQMLAGDPESALSVLTEGYEQLEAMGDTFRFLSAFLAQSLYELGRFDEAEARARVAVDASEDLEHFVGLGSLARVLARRGRFDEAEAMAREAVNYFDGTEYGADQTGVILDLAEVLRLAERTDEAGSTLRHALDLFERREDIVSAAKTRALIAELA